jgi:Flp pilus assembly protein TadG
MRNSKGSIAVEALLLVPGLFIFATTIVFVSRLTDASGSVHRAADIAARVASQSSTNTAVIRARTAALLAVSADSSACTSPGVSVEQRRVQREVYYVVRVVCKVNLEGLGLLSLGSRSVSATSSEVVDVFTNR